MKIKKILPIFLALFFISCSKSFNNINNVPEIDVLKAEAKINIDPNQYKGNFIILDKISNLNDYYISNYFRPVISINDYDKGFVTILGRTIFISNLIPTNKISFNLSLPTQGIFYKIDNNGDGVIISKLLPFVDMGIEKVYATFFKNYQPQSTYKNEANNLTITELINIVEPNKIDEFFGNDKSSLYFNKLSDFKMDKKGDGLLLYSKRNVKYKNNVNLSIFDPGSGSINNINDSVQIEIKNFKILKETKKPTGLKDQVQLVKKSDNSFFVVGINISYESYGELTNSPFIDDNGNGTVTWFETIHALPFDKYKIYTQKVEDYKFVNEKIELMTINSMSVDSKINNQGNGVIVFIDENKLYFSHIKNFKQEDKIQLSVSPDIINPSMGINSKGNGLIVWQDKTTVYGRILKNYQLQ